MHNYYPILWVGAIIGVISTLLIVAAFVVKDGEKETGFEMCIRDSANDAVCITNLQPDTYDMKEWTVKPMRRQSKAKTDNVLGIKHRDLVEYTLKNGETHRGYVTALYPEQ